MLQAYIDDSGSGGPPPVFVLAGYVSTAEKWEVFSAEWVAVLHSTPTIDYFKMHEAKWLEGQFYRWTVKDRDTKVWELLTVLRRHAEVGLRCVIPHEIYKRVISGKLARQVDNPYVLAFLGIM